MPKFEDYARVRRVGVDETLTVMPTQGQFGINAQLGKGPEWVRTRHWKKHEVRNHPEPVLAWHHEDALELISNLQDEDLLCTGENGLGSCGQPATHHNTTGMAFFCDECAEPNHSHKRFIE